MDTTANNRLSMFDDMRINNFNQADPSILATYQTTFIDQGYVLIEQALSKELCWTAYHYMELQSTLQANTAGDDIVSGTFFAYGDPLMETILKLIQPLMEQVTQRKLWPTHSYCRLYKKNDVLETHRDRVSCEIAATVSLGHDLDLVREKDADYLWPIFMDGTPVAMNPGDMAIYMGCEVEHWREAFAGEKQGQLFLFYVDQAQPYAELCKFDTRTGLGEPADTRNPKKIAFAQTIYNKISAGKKG